MKWFSTPQPTIEAAQALHRPGVLAFDPAAVFRTPEGEFVLGLLRRDVEWPPVAEARHIEAISGNVMVSACDPLLGLWKPVKEQVAR